VLQLSCNPLPGWCYQHRVQQGNGNLARGHMNNLAVFNYNGQTISRRHDGFINLTQMCQANDKRIDNWTRLKQTQDYTRVLGNSLTSEVVCSEEGVNGGTWGHPSLAINLARWISPEFAVWCDGHIFNLMSTGTTAIAHQIPKTYSQALLEAAKLAEENERLEAQNILLEQQNEQLSEAVDELFNYSSIVRQYYCQFSQICLKPNKIVTISIGFQGFGNSIGSCSQI
jgi:hypothetical protein